ncbi:hypothetical protein [Komagataeibacter oboediens]|uniref:hypothetical protein n=1 Tax=Komagataeibacter oboediens TaxID=65958 RepID=UPI001C2DEE6D|nr:hypothetical protein [Komagataeibacter oboediens]MBV1825741.1 hypothetical protein [Komagataeibacter oboediens]
MENSSDFEPMGKVNPSALSRKEERSTFDHDERIHKNHPNSVMIPFGRSFISWHSDSGIAILALIILFILCVLSFLIVCVRSTVEIYDGPFRISPDEKWISSFLNIVGQGIIATAGAVVGAGGATLANKISAEKDK